MTVLIVDDAVILSISQLTTVIALMIKFDVDKPRLCFRREA
jgi:hypothetical protein